MEELNAYLTNYPNGTFKSLALARIASLQDGPSTTTRNLSSGVDPATFTEEADQASEDQIGLDKGQRRDVQRRLTGLGFDTRVTASSTTKPAPLSRVGRLRAAIRRPATSTSCSSRRCNPRSYPPRAPAGCRRWRRCVQPPAWWRRRRTSPQYQRRPGWPNRRDDGRNVSLVITARLTNSAYTRLPESPSQGTDGIPALPSIWSQPPRKPPGPSPAPSKQTGDPGAPLGTLGSSTTATRGRCSVFVRRSAQMTARLFRFLCSPPVQRGPSTLAFANGSVGRRFCSSEFRN